MRTRLARSIVLLLACAEPAHAYRPFEATNADVAPPGELEIEFGPVAYVDQPHGSITKAPVVTINAASPPTQPSRFAGSSTAARSRWPATASG